jgi:hypothetical protein
MHGCLAPCTDPRDKCDFCLDHDPFSTFSFYPALRWYPNPDTQRDWQKMVLCLDQKGQSEMKCLHEQQGFLRGMIVQVSRCAKRCNGAIRVRFTENGNKVLEMDSFDIRQVLIKHWARWLRDPPPNYLQPFLPFPEPPISVEEPKLAAGDR